jgi:UDP-N-acetylmuramoylalanine--D-glutamate ligase
MNVKGKKVTILGAVRSGVSAALLVQKLEGKPFVSDMADASKLNDEMVRLREANIPFEFGGHTEKVYDCDFIITSPGVPTKSKVIQEALKRKIEIFSELEFASYFCKGKVIAITGSNGKTTTTSLVHHILTTSNKKTYLAGNIGFAFSNICLDVKEDEFVALEVSSFQLDWNKKFKPYISIITNITPDHLDRYETFEDYRNAKLSIYKTQDENDYVILNYDDKFSQREINNKNVNTIFFSLNEKPKNSIYLDNENIIFEQNGKNIFVCKTSDIKIKGLHNIANSMCAIVAAKLSGCSNEDIIKGLQTFEGVEHRLEFVREINGVKYVNDSKATNVDSLYFALKSFDNPIFLILGGIDKGNDYNQIKDLVLQKVKKIYAIGQSADKIFNFFHHDIKVEIKSSLKECVDAANSEAREGDIVLLSPACASMDMFKNYEERGRIFKELVNNL